MQVNDEFYMDLAIKEAWKYQFLTFKNPAVGALIKDKNGKILSINAHQKQGFAHAELNAIIDAINKTNKTNFKSDDAKTLYEYALNNHKNIFNQASIYITLSPCTHHGKTPPCAKLLKELGFSQIIYAIEDETLSQNSEEVLSGLKIKKNILKEKAIELLEPFLMYKKGIVLFKLSTTLNGAYDGKITNDKVDEYTHRIRQLVDFLIIGGNTIIKDKPILDTRKANNELQGIKNPNIFIQSKNFSNILNTLPLFNVKNRSVDGGQNLPNLQSKFVLMEGGENFLNTHKNLIDYLMIIQNTKIKQSNLRLNLNLNLKLIHQRLVDDNTINIFKIIKEDI